MLGAAITTASPVGELITVAAAKDFLRLDGSRFDGELPMTIAAAIGEVEQLTGARLLRQVVSFSAESWKDLSALRVAPVVRITGITYLDGAKVEQDLAPSGFELCGAPFEQRLIATTSLPQAQPGSIKVIAEVGYGDEPEDVPAQLLYACYAALRAKFYGQEADLQHLTVNHRFWL